jgi:hypothetical protein
MNWQWLLFWKGNKMDFAGLIARVETLETQVASLLSSTAPVVTTLATSTGNKTVENIADESVAVVTKALPIAATTIADIGAAKATVAKTTGTLARIEVGLEEFLTDAPPLITAINPAAGALATGIATAMQALLGLLGALHTSTTAPAVAAATEAAK